MYSSCEFSQLKLLSLIRDQKSTNKMKLSFAQINQVEIAAAEGAKQSV
jgi:hypothetical protein